MGKLLALIYGIVCYVIFLVSFLYAIGFVGNILVPKGIDSNPGAPLLEAVVTDLFLIGLFAVQHSVMARQGFKRAWTRIVPVAVERSTYVLFSSLALDLLFWRWQPLGGVIWDVRNGGLSLALTGLSLFGWLIVLASTFHIDHFDLCGLRQVYLNFVGRRPELIPFRAPGLYRVVRHPLYLGMLVAFWATPTMTVTHLVFAVSMTGYILVGTRLEERDLVRHFGATYREYQKKVGRLVPFIR